eukprot:CAMPEP_0117082342 /NCGR_PEP_ID=MMETSP0472-20121206/57988_1 /TAXON_ID=693140 ORGANISM="Tiarina fusus, Strain LIS" /NCGR_SAMPLE_ID=MMETSP0472 /ASSEMBLY_ACC=CAM_ASM_000603 /LENGTH=267 /DNA_ID=CAMNT_0004810547 /DNA_START=11 /DNA_END=814 /DNA_ORIENTATION=+
MTSPINLNNNNDLDLEDFNDVEDYSDVPASKSNDDDTQTTSEHDQLPSVEEIKSANNFVKSSSSSSRRCSIIALGFAGLTILLVGLIVAAVVDNPEKRAAQVVPNVTAALHEIALNGASDFEDPDGYQYAAMWNILPDANVHETYSYERLQQRYAMYCLYHATNPKRTWVENSGWKRMGVDECKWYGVTCDDKDDGMVKRIELKSNGLGGTIPEEVLLIPKLQVFNVNSNTGMEGEVPSPMCEVQEARKLDIKVDCSVVGCECCSNC